MHMIDEVISLFLGSQEHGGKYKRLRGFKLNHSSTVVIPNYTSSSSNSIQYLTALVMLFVQCMPMHQLDRQRQDLLQRIDSVSRTFF